jgi:hypothetical protein
MPGDGAVSGGCPWSLAGPARQLYDAAIDIRSSPRRSKPEPFKETAERHDDVGVEVGAGAASQLATL